MNSWILLIIKQLKKAERHPIKKNQMIRRKEYG